MNTYQLIEQLANVLREDMHRKGNNVEYVQSLMDALLALGDVKKFY